MIRGTVNARFEAVIPLRVRGPCGAELSFDAVVDKGFTSSLTLPVTAVTALGLVRQSSSAATLGDGSVRSFDVYAAEVEWDGNCGRCWCRPSAAKCSLGCGSWRGMSCGSRSCRVARSRSARTLEERRTVRYT
jgi:hypothetical protein